MEFNCRWIGVGIGLIILVATVWPSIIGATASMWVVIVAAAMLMLYAILHNAGEGSMCRPSSKQGTAKKKRR